MVEIGPGPGGLTRALLLEGARRVIAIERDARCLAALAEIANVYPDRLEVVAGDALAVDPAELVASGGAGTAAAPARIVGNLPYNIATLLLARWLEAEPWPPWFDRLTLMFQREVAERIVATPAERASSFNWRTGARLTIASRISSLRIMSSPTALRPW